MATRAEGEGGKHEMWAGQFYSRGAYTIFQYTRAENATFAILSREGMWHLRPGYGEKLLLNIVKISLHTYTRYFPICIIVYITRLGSKSKEFPAFGSGNNLHAI